MSQALKTTIPWHKFEISSDQTHHLINQKPAYLARFLSVSKFHSPGLAPAVDESGALHIDALGKPAYHHRFLQTFGFYEERAAVKSSSGWHHVLPDGSPLYSPRYAWCGNFQEGFCAVAEQNKGFYHIDLQGERVYPQNFSYAGDFHDGYAVIQNEKGLHTHIDSRGNYLHDRWFLDLDVFHKGFARAKDQKGWFHINFQGKALYTQRFKNIEPFYNGIARVETEHGALLRISEEGKPISTLREAIHDEFHQVSAELVSYWRYNTLQAANQLQLFDSLPSSIENISRQLKLPQHSICKLLRALQEMGYVDITDKKHWSCTGKGEYLQAGHPYSLKKASQLWNEEHLTCWKNIHYSLKTSLPAFNHLYKKSWFDWLTEHPEKNQTYHEALSTYARRDYRDFSLKVNLNNHSSLLDIGGSTGALLINILKQHPHLKGFLLDLPNVIRLTKIPEQLKNCMECIPVDFFKPWPPIQVESAILSRVLHDWADEQALKILKKVHSSLSNNPSNRLYVIEKIQDKNNPHGSLLDLHMMIMTGGVERTLEDFTNLFQRAGFTLEKTQSLNETSTILIAKKTT
ncbi:MAG: methyltransferase [Simkaniaceae bacterium]|nr:methyltransferase [Candidatus Sacchlamyda saccharinae]